MTIRRFHRAAFAGVAITLGACNVHDRLLDVQTPDIVDPSNAQSQAGAQAYYTAATGDFSRFIGGDRGGGSPLGLNLTGGLLADEIFSARAGTESIDNRSINFNNFPIDTWAQVGNTYARTVRAIKLVGQFPPATNANAQLAQLHANLGFVLTITAESYCSGIPLWDGKSDVAITTQTFTTDQLYAAAIAQLDSALVLAPTGAINQFARVGKARTLVDQATPQTLVANTATAAALVGTANVPTTFTQMTLFSALTTGVDNTVFNWMVSTKNFGASDREGGTGLDYVSSLDPRIKVDGTKVARGQDGTPTPLLTQYTSVASNIVIASGVEARMIEAEALLNAGDNPGFIAKLNEARANGGVAGLAAKLTDPGSPSARQDMLFRERGFWMYLTAHRLGDMRRLVRQYGRDAEKVFPTGAYFKGGSYGTDVVLIPSQQETNNPSWAACTDRKP